MNIASNNPQTFGNQQQYVKYSSTKRYSGLLSALLCVIAGIAFSNAAFASAAKLQQPREFNMNNVEQHNFRLTKESQLHQQFNSVIAPFWQQQVQHITFNGSNNTAPDSATNTVTLNGAYILHPNAIGSIVLVSGRTESALKYRELVYDLYQNQYSVFILDHRGQGQSQRLTNNPNKGYVTDFTDYVADLKTFYDNYVKPNSQHTPTLLAHSMGCAISGLYLAQYPNDFAKAVLSSPMFGIKAPITPKQAKVIIGIAQSLNTFFSDSPWYFIGQGNYKQEAFAGNPITSSEIRFQYHNQVLSEYPETRLGGVTYHWLDKAIDAMQTVLDLAPSIKTPTLILQSGNDRIVDNAAQVPVCNAMPHCQLQVIADAEHELFMEQDQYRTPALQAALQFFAEGSN